MKFPALPSVLAAFAAAALVFVVSGCSKKTVDGKPLRLYVQVNDVGSMSTRSTRPLTMPDGMTFYVKSEPVVLERMINNVELVRVANGRLAFALYLNDEGTTSLYRTTVTERSRFLILEYNGLPIAERQIDTPISDGRYYTFASISDEEMEDLVLDMRKNVAKIQEARAKKGR